jgi:hypothetical protein
MPAEQHTHKHFSGARLLARWVQDNSRLAGWRASWTSLLPTGISILEQGDESSAHEAAKYVSKLNTAIDVPTKVWRHDIVGYFPDVPTALSGDPEAMWIQDETRTDRAPLRVWVGLNSSSEISGKQLQQRGCVLAAFAIALSNTRPVYITPYVSRGCWDLDSRARSEGIHTGTVSWDVRTTPLVMAELLGSLTRQEVSRGVGHTACCILDPKQTGGYNPLVSGEANMRQLLGCDEQDLFLPQIHSHDELLSNPVDWLKTQVTHYTDQEDN